MIMRICYVLSIGGSKVCNPNKQDGGCSRKERISVFSLKYVMFLCKGTYNYLLHNCQDTQDFISWCFVQYFIWKARDKYGSERIVHRFDRGNKKLKFTRMPNHRFPIYWDYTLTNLQTPYQETLNICMLITFVSFMYGSLVTLDITLCVLHFVIATLNW
jgi:hypothetical protein